MGQAFVFVFFLLLLIFIIYANEESGSIILLNVRHYYCGSFFLCLCFLTIWKYCTRRKPYPKGNKSKTSMLQVERLGSVCLTQIAWPLLAGAFGSWVGQPSRTNHTAVAVEPVIDLQRERRRDIEATERCRREEDGPTRNKVRRGGMSYRFRLLGYALLLLWNLGCCVVVLAYGLKFDLDPDAVGTRLQGSQSDKWMKSVLLSIVEVPYTHTRPAPRAHSHSHTHTLTPTHTDTHTHTHTHTHAYTHAYTRTRAVHDRKE
jgi:hypothetical protein